MASDAQESRIATGRGGERCTACGCTINQKKKNRSLVSLYWDAKQLPCSASIDYGHAGVVRRADFFRDAQHEQGTIIVRRSGTTELIRREKNCAGNVLDGSIFRQFSKQREKPLNAKLFMVWIFGFDDAVGSKDEQIAWLQIKLKNFVVHFRQQAERHAFNN